MTAFPSARRDPPPLRSGSLVTLRGRLKQNFLRFGSFNDAGYEFPPVKSVTPNPPK